MATIEHWTDFIGRTVEVTDSGLTHITSSHPEFGDPLPRIRATLTHPTQVMRDEKMGRAECYYRRIGSRMMTRVVVLFRPTPDGWKGEVLTAHFTKRFGPGEEHLWP